MVAIRAGGTRRPRQKAVGPRLQRSRTAPGSQVAPTTSALDLAKSEFLGLSRRWAALSIEDVAEIRAGLAVRTLDGLNGVLPGVTYRIVPKSTLAALKRRSD